MPQWISCSSSRERIARYALGSLLTAFVLAVFFIFLYTLPTFAQDRFGVEYGTGTGLSTQDIRVTVAKIIRVSLGILGTVFLVFVIYGGVLWMTARGAQEQVEKAKKVITNATIGLIIILLAFGITSFVIGRLEEATGGGGVPGDGGEPPGCIGGTCATGGGFNVVAVDPPDTAINVSLCTAVQAIFNANVAPATINPQNVRVREVGGSASTGTFAVNGNSFSFSHPDFAPNASYEASITTDVQSLSGDYLEREKVWTFTTGTESDNVLPTVVTVYPPSGGTDICLAAPIQVIFSEEMMVTTLTAANVRLEKEVGGAWVGVPLGSVVPGTDFMSLAAYPVGGFEATTVYRVTLLPGITDTCGNPLDGNGNGTADGPGDTYDSSASGPWTFTTGETAECTPLITSVTPSAAYYSDQVVTVGGDYFFLGAGSDTYFNNFAADQNCFNAQFVPNTLCRVSWNNNEIQVRVPAGSTSGPLTVDVGGKRSNAVNFQVLSPYIGSLSPPLGPVGSYVTMSGLQFGTVRGRVMIGSVEAEFPCADNWTDGSVVIRIPPGLSPGTYPVQLFTAPPGNRPSNRLSFTVNTGPLSPGICTMVPQCGLSGTSVALSGERFGGTQGLSTVTFGTLSASASLWSDTAITATAPAFSQNGNYPVAVTVQGLRSNEIGFATPCAPGTGSCPNGIIDAAGEQCDAPDLPPLTCSPPATGQWQCDANCQLFGCSGGGGLCGNNVAEGSEQCDDTNGDGIDLRGLTCATYGGVFTGGTLACDLNCGFDTSGCTTPADEPHIIENASCDLNIQSPSPFRDTNDACRNARVSVTFDRDMDDATFVDIDTVSCGNGTSFDAALCVSSPLAGAVSAADAGGGREAYVFTPTVLFVPNTWYRVTVPATVASAAAGVTLSGPYEWHFRVRPGVALCAPTAVNVTPPSATITTSGGTQGFLAIPTGGNCNMLAGTFTYAWSSSDASRATLSGSTNNTETATAIAETDPGVPVDITAQESGGAQGSAQLSIVFDPLICQTNDDCNACGTGASQCVNNQCTPVVTDVSPSPSPVGSWVTISGCYFGLNQGTVTYATNRPGLWPDPAVCGPSTWTNTQIISEIPNAQTTDPADDAVSGPLTVRRPDGAEDESPGSLTVGGSARPNLCWINPTSGAIATAFTVRGQGFGASRATGDSVQFDATVLADANYTSWAENTVAGTVPTGVSSGAREVTLTNDNAVSNPLQFTVTGGTIGTLCDSESGTPACQADDGRCTGSPGLFCDPNAGCTCQQAPSPRVVSHVPTSGTTDVCRNAVILVTFDQLMDHGSLAGNIFLEDTRGDAHPITVSAIDYDMNGDSVMQNLTDRTEARITPQEPMEAVAGYRVRVTDNVKSRYGVLLGASGYYTWQFTTGSVICQIGNVTVRIVRNVPPPNPNLIGEVSRYDLFLCAGRDNCPDDVVPGSGTGAAGNQHRWTARAWDTSTSAQELTAGVQFHWTETDPGNLFTLSGTEVPQVDATAAVAQKGTATFNVGAHGEGMGAATTTVSAEIDVCENPWPNPPPYTDTNYNFSLWYCRDAGVQGTDGDIPALNVSPVMKDTSPDPRILREYLFLRDPTRDAIGLRIYENPNQLSLRDWYQQNAAQPGSPGESTIDGFPALRDGRSVYVLAPNIAGAFYTNVFVLSYNEGADGDTQQIMNGLIAHWKFMTGTADADKPAIQRDMKRVTDLGTIRGYLTAYADIHKVCSGTTIACTDSIICGTGQTCNATYPALTAGSYLIGYSTSRWPSWQATLGNALGRALPTDPSNTFPRECSAGTRVGQTCTSDFECEGGVCVIPLCPASDFDQASCWNDQAKQFVCPTGSSLYAYSSTNGSSFTLGANLEYLTVGSSGAVGECQVNYQVGP